MNPLTVNPSNPNILMLCPAPPRPPTGGGVRSYFMAKTLAQIANLHLCILTDRDGAASSNGLDIQAVETIQLNCEPSGQINGHDGYGRYVNMLRGVSRVLAPWARGARDLIPVAENNCVNRIALASQTGSSMSPARRIYANLLLKEVQWGTNYCNFLPARALCYYDPFVQRWPEIESILRRMKVDVLWLEHSLLLPLVPLLRRLFPHAAVVCDAHNVEHWVHRHQATIASNELTKRWHDVQAVACERMERSGYGGCQTVIACSDVDASKIRSISPTADARVIPNGVDTTYFSPRAAEATPPTILFTGCFGYEPNVDAVNYFRSAIWPRISDAVPSCRFVIVGAQAREVFGDLSAQNQLLSVHSDVPDMRLYFDAAAVVVVPIRAGSGTRIKILEAMAMAKPVVSTTIGAEGLNVRNGEHLVIADDPREVADQVITLLRNSERRIEMGRRARQFVSEMYDWSMMLPRLEAILHQTRCH